MKRLMAVAAMLFMMPVAAGAQDAIPALKGTWRGTGKILLFGTTEHLSGTPQNAVVRDLEVTHTVAGQDGPLIWGTTSSANNDIKEYAVETGANGTPTCRQASASKACSMPLPDRMRTGLWAESPRSSNACPMARAAARAST